MNFMEIVMEAKKKKEPGKKKPEEKEDDLPEDDSEPEDLTEEEPEEGDTDDLPPDDSEPEDLTEEEPEDDTIESEEIEETTPADDANGDDLPPDDSEPEDLTGDEAGSDLPAEDSEPEDMTAIDGEEGTDETGDDTGADASTTDDMGAETPEEPATSPREIRLLQEDFVDLHFKTKDFITKLNSLDKSNMILNQVVIQIDKNLSRLKTALWEYVVYDYDKTEYVANLYRYNQFIEVFRTNLEMLKSTKDYIMQNQEDENAQPSSKRNK